MDGTIGMTLEEIETRIPAWYSASCEKDGPAFHLESDAGRGKSTIMGKFPKIMKSIDPGGNYGYSYINGLTITLPFLCGFMEMNQEVYSASQERKRRMTNFTLPAWWYTDEGKPLEAYDGGLILIDEEDKMEKDEKKLTRDMKLMKRVGVHQLPPGWVVWSAGNPLGSRNGGNKTFDFIINAQILIQVRDSTEAWVNWARRNNVLPEIISFAEDNPHLLFMKAPTIQAPYMTPRSLAQADIYLRAIMRVYSKRKIPVDVITQNEIAGGIGKEGAEALFLSIRMGQELPSYADMIANPKTVAIPAEPDRLRMFAYKVADWARPEDSAALGQIMARLPNEFAFLMIKMIRDRNARVLVMPEFRAWVKSNAQLIAVVEGYEREQGRRDPLLSAVASAA